MTPFLFHTKGVGLQFIPSKKSILTSAAIISPLHPLCALCWLFPEVPWYHSSRPISLGMRVSVLSSSCAACISSLRGRHLQPQGGLCTLVPSSASVSFGICSPHHSRGSLCSRPLGLPGSHLSLNVIFHIGIANVAPKLEVPRLQEKVSDLAVIIGMFRQSADFIIEVLHFAKS
jgi:hypothetical protein